MTSLDALTREAVALANGALPLTAAESEVARQMQICNACRYCEGFCAVFPAMTRRLDFGKADIHYLANLCHNCGACLHACQYAPPHEFAVNVPQSLAVVRGQTYADYAWPPALGSLYKRNGLTVSLALAAGLAQVLESKTYNEIIVTRVTVPVGEDIGFLPGTEEEKRSNQSGSRMNRSGTYSGNHRAKNKDKFIDE